jgi:hypothetical protein
LPRRIKLENLRLGASVQNESVRAKREDLLLPTTPSQPSIEVILKINLL